jgi:hypothetical protein
MAVWRGRVLAATAALLSAVVLTGCAASSGSTGAGGPAGTGVPNTGLTPIPVPRPTPTPGSTPNGIETTSGPCPPTFGELQSAMGPVHPGVAGPRSLEVPLGAQAALVCAYGPLGPASPPTLSWSRVLDPSQAGDLLDTVNAKVTPQSDLLGRVNCPMDNGSAALVRFSYADQVAQEVLVRLTGCQPASSNHGTTVFRPDIVKAIRALHP